MEEVNPRFNSSTGGFTFSTAVVYFFALSLIVSVILFVANLGEQTDGYIYLSYLASPIAIALCGVTMLCTKKIKFLQVFPVKCSPKYYIIGVLLIFGLLFSLSWVNEVSVNFFKLFGYKPREDESYFPDLTGGKVVLALLVVAVMPALFEEFLFRGLILNCCAQNMGTIRTIFVVGFCFSLFHASPEQTVYQFIAGCAFALIAVRSGSILPSVVMHFINNSLIVIIQASGAFNEAGELAISAGANTAIFVLSLISLIVALIWLIIDKNIAEKTSLGKRISFVFEHKPVTKCEKGAVRRFFLFASLGIAVLGINWILLLFGVG